MIFGGLDTVSRCSVGSIVEGEGKCGDGEGDVGESSTVRSGDVEFVRVPGVFPISVVFAW